MTQLLSEDGKNDLAHIAVGLAITALPRGFGMLDAWTPWRILLGAVAGFGVGLLAEVKDAGGRGVFSSGSIRDMIGYTVGGAAGGLL